MSNLSSPPTPRITLSTPQILSKQIFEGKARVENDTKRIYLLHTSVQ